jgi:branched-subunit amino acid ABC-type transport system permease component
MDALSLFGLLAVTAMLVTYALEARCAWYIFAFAIACGLGSIYGFLQGAWPFGAIEAIWTLVALRRWNRAWSFQKARNLRPTRSATPRTARRPAAN